MFLRMFVSVPSTDAVGALHEVTTLMRATSNTFLLVYNIFPSHHRDQ